MLKKAGAWLGSGLGYLVYGTGLLVFLLWLLFPKEAMRRFSEDSLGRVCPELRWQVGTVALELPAGLTLRTIEGYAQGEEKKPLVRIDTATLQPLFVESMRAGSVQAGYRVAVGKGGVSGLVRMDGGPKGLHVEGTVLDLKLTEVPLLSRQVDRVLQGSVSGTFAGAVIPATGEIIEMEGQVRVENGRLSLKRPILSHVELPFSLGTVILHGQGKTLRLEQGLVTSELFDGRFSGLITMHRDPGLIQLDVKGDMQPKNKFFKGLDNTVALQAFRGQLRDTALPFRITGDLANPGIHYEEFSMLVQSLEKELR